MNVVPIPNGAFAENSYLIIDEQAGRCVIIDPGQEPGLILHKVEQAGVQPDAIWLTHAHVDHVMGVGHIAAKTGVPISLHPADRPLYDAAAAQAAAFGLAFTDKLPPPDRAFTPGEHVKVGELSFEVRHAPGHSPGSVCLYAPALRVVFSGDTLFRGGPGATGRSYSNHDTIIRSITGRLLDLPPETVVHTGHGEDTTIGAESGSISR